MNTAEKITLPEQLLSLSKQMLEAAESKQWETLTELEKTRLPIFEQVFANGIADYVELAQEVLALDEQTKQLAEAEMPVVRSELQKMQNSTKASAAYQTIQNISTK